MKKIFPAETFLIYYALCGLVPLKPYKSKALLGSKWLLVRDTSLGNLEHDNQHLQKGWFWTLLWHRKPFYIRYVGLCLDKPDKSPPWTIYLAINTKTFFLKIHKLLSKRAVYIAHMTKYTS